MKVTPFPTALTRQQGTSRVFDDFESGNPDRVYAITFDLNLAKLRERYPGAYSGAYDAICRVLGEHGFRRQQQSVYFGQRGSNSVTCVLAIQDVQKRHPWFRHVVGDVRMLRIEEHNDLYPALGQPQLPFEDTGTG